VLSLEDIGRSIMDYTLGCNVLTQPGRLEDPGQPIVGTTAETSAFT
jgi:hypothetical protein